MTSSAAGRRTVLVTSRSFSTGSRDLVAELEAADVHVVRGPAGHDLESLRAVLGDAVGWIAGTGPVTAAHLDAAPLLQIVARYGVGVDSVDRVAAAARGILVTNTPGANSDAVADHAIALALALLRGLIPGDRDVRAGTWPARRGRELGALTVGVIGFGRIGRAVAARLSGFGSEILVHDPWLDAGTAAAADVETVALADMAGRCDLVSLHAPGGRRIIDAAWLSLARPGLVLVNTARADLVDEDEVASALRTGRLGGFAADTLAAETGGAPSPLLADDLADRVVLTPHVAAQTVEAVDRMGGGTTADVLAVLRGAAPAHPVPPPEDS